MLKWITPAVLSVAVLGGLAASGPAYAGDRDSRYDRNYHHDDWNAEHRDRNGNYRYSTNGRDLMDRTDRMRTRIEQLYRDGRMSRDHRDRAMERLDRVYSDRNNGRMSSSRIRTNNDWLDRTEDVVDQWSHGTYSNRWGHR